MFNEQTNFLQVVQSDIQILQNCDLFIYIC